MSLSEGRIGKIGGMMSFLDDLGDAIVGKIEDFTEAVEDKLESFGDKAVGFLDSIEDYIPDTVIKICLTENNGHGCLL